MVEVVLLAGLSHFWHLQVDNDGHAPKVECLDRDRSEGLYALLISNEGRISFHSSHLRHPHLTPRP